MIIKVKVTPELIAKQVDFFNALLGQSEGASFLPKIFTERLVTTIIADLHLEASMDEEKEDVQIGDLPY